MSSHPSSQAALLGEISFLPATFSQIEEKLQSFKEKTFRELTSRHRFRLINSALLELIQGEPEGCFLLSSVLDYIGQINELKVYEEVYNLSHFEFWLNLFSELTPEEKHVIRGKIVGKVIPRESYQSFFPIGMGKSYPGSHFVAAHLSPDMDTTVASFWGWLDAFGAKVGDSLHLWCLPGGPSDSAIERLFDLLFGKGLFNATARTAKSLTVTAQDLLTQTGMVKTKGHISSYDLDHSESDKALVYVDDAGYYLGDWRAEDVETVRQIGNSFKSTLHLFENGFHIGIISLFSKDPLSVGDFPTFLHTLFGEKLETSTSTKELTAEGKETFSLLLKNVLKLENGLETTFGELLDVLGSFGIEEAPLFKREVESLPASSLFDSKGVLIENRTAIFHVLEKLIELLDVAIRKGRGLVDRLDIVMQIKEKVLGIPSSFLTMKSDVEEIRQKMRHFSTLTVVIPEEEGRLFPVGIVRASDLRRETLGTVSLRDFSNFLEMHMAPYLQVISVIDHHKVDLKTVSQPQIVVGDAQSCNVLIAEISFRINDAYSLGGMSREEIDRELDNLKNLPLTAKNLLLMERILKRKRAAGKNHSWVSKEREWAEYLSFLYAILDDTDLLSKVSDRDVIVVASLLNRLKSIAAGKEVEIIDLSDLTRDNTFAKLGAERILKHPDMYSIYKKIYTFKEKEIEENMLLSAEGFPSTFFSDTKEQNGCCRIGQTKLFASNFVTYQKEELHLKQRWIRESEEKARNHPALDLFLHMVSTVPSAESVFMEKSTEEPDHKDEMWLWMTGTEESVLHLARFLSGFQGAKEVRKNAFTIELLGGQSALYEEIFKRDFLPCPIVKREVNPPLPIAVLKFKPGTINSRKSLITPFLPRPL